MEKVGVYEAKTHLPKLLERVAEGYRVTITKHGVPIAVLKPYDPEKVLMLRESLFSCANLEKANAWRV